MAVCYEGRNLVCVQRVVVAEIQYHAHRPPCRLLRAKKQCHCPRMCRSNLQIPALEHLMGSSRSIVDDMVIQIRVAPGKTDTPALHNRDNNSNLDTQIRASRYYCKFLLYIIYIILYIMY